MRWLDSFKEEHIRKKEENQEMIDLFEEIIREFYIGRLKKIKNSVLNRYELSRIRTLTFPVTVFSSI
jgi:hypothetical protein